MPALVDRALPVRINVVLLVIDRTVPITTLPAVFMMFPTLISLRNNDPRPVTVVEARDVVMVPVLAVLGQAVALQFPVPADEMVAAIASEVIMKTTINKRVRILEIRDGTVSLIFFYRKLVIRMHPNVESGVLFDYS
jgi:hypothetical protein